MDRENNPNIKPFLMFLCSLVPGCSHMYLGLMKRGIQLLLAFCLLIGSASLIGNLEFIIVPILVVIYVYSFFDGYSIYRNLKAGKVVEDESVIEGLDSVRKILTNGYWIGLVLVILGTIVIIRTGISAIPSYWEIRREYYHIFRNIGPTLFLLGLGIFLMVKGSKQRKKIKEDTQQISE